MKISYNWLKEFVEIDISVQEFCQKLTMFGVEVESITHLGDEYENIVVGKILSVAHHPKSEHLKICSLDVGEGSPLSVICGAPNVKKNQTISLAKIDAIIGERKVRKAKIRGIESFGMICSEKELGISEDHSDIMVLDDRYKPGTPLAQALNIDDYIIEVEITPNRPDLLGMLGIAREVAAMLNKNYSAPKIEFQESGTSASEFISVEIKDPELCPRYCCRILQNVMVKPSPDWLQQRLKAVGLNPINNIVDVTNYVLMEYGHPLHAFDYEKIFNRTIIARRAKNDEKVKLLDEQIHTLSSQNLVIADGKKPVALAGILGGMNSSILPETKDIVLECAYFNPRNIRATSLSQNLNSESSYRFERGTDPNRLEEIINRTAQLIQLTAGGEICKGIVEAYPKKNLPKTIFLRTKRVNDILDTQLQAKTIKSYLQKFEFSVSEKNENFDVTIPTFRPDIECEIDIIEEIARCYGYENIRSSFSVPHIEDRRKRMILRRIRDHFVNLGFFEVCNLSFASPDSFDKLDIPKTDYRRDGIELANPLGGQFAIMRTTLIPDLLSNVALNLSHKFENFKLFELNKIYLKNDDGTSSEPISLTGAITGKFVPEYWNSQSQNPSFFDIKGLIESLFTILHLSDNLNFRNSKEPYYVVEQCADLFVKGEKVGSFGVLRKDVLAKFEIKNSTMLFELDLSKLVKSIPEIPVKHTEVIKFPPVLRDIAIITPQEISVAEIEKSIRSINPKIIKNVSLFDVYQGKQIEEICRGLAFNITFQSDTTTLTDKYVDKLFDKIVNKLSLQYKIKLRQK